MSVCVSTCEGLCVKVCVWKCVSVCVEVSVCECKSVYFILALLICVMYKRCGSYFHVCLSRLAVDTVQIVVR